MSGQDEDTEKTFDATPQKLLEARKKGEIAKSNDLLVAAGYAGLLLALLMTGSTGIRQAGTAMMVMLDQADQLAPQFFGAAIAPPMAGLAYPILMAFLPLFLFPAAAVVLAIFAQQAFVFAPSKLSPKLSRLSFISNAKNKFGRDGIFEFAKSFVKLILYSVIVALFIHTHLHEMIAVLYSSPPQVLSLMAELCISFIFIVVLISGSVGVVDAFWQHFSHLRKNRMSHKEIMDEAKNSEGDPHLKQERRQRAMAISQTQMMADVPKADVIIVNPTHYAVALMWSRKPGEAPQCVAKGIDEIALAIREAAQTANVPIHSDPPTARALFATTEIGDQVTPDFYSVVAAAIRFSENMRRAAKARE
jgi:flagellar biosynthetic protein FlhB